MATPPAEGLSDAGDLRHQEPGEPSGDLKPGVKNSMSGCGFLSRGAAALAAAATAVRASRVPRVFTGTHRRLHTSLQSCSFAKELFLGNIEQVRQALAPLSYFHLRWYLAGVLKRQTPERLGSGKCGFNRVAEVFVLRQDLLKYY